MGQQDNDITQVSLGELHQSEVELIYLMRTRYRYGEIKIELRDGLPNFIVQTTIREKLG